jgi:gliding motility-associated-like protein
MNRDTIHASICDNIFYQLPNGSFINTTGIYIDSFTNYLGCDSIIITHLNVLQNPNISFPNVLPICLGNSITLNAFVPNATYQWNDLNTNPNNTFTSSGNYWVIISNPPCKADTANVKLNFIDCNCRMSVPNAFTPNDDGIDDLFKPICTCDLNIINYHFKIYSRLGQLVFSTNDLNASWNGTFKSLPQEVNTYSYIIEWTNPTTNEKEITKGNVHLIR